ncbi:MAG: hypothetical protein KDC24_12515 [Saprospiraceae bacterium]|nr:hypothetical protein [Saprospiraceae bacterium]
MSLTTKTLFLAFLLTLLLPEAGIGQRDSFFVIKLGQVDLPVFDSFDLYRNFGIVFEVPSKDEPSTIFLGGFTEKAEANRVLEQLPNHPTLHPQITYLEFKRKKPMRTVHLALFEVGTPIDWKGFFQQGFPVFAIQENDVIRVVAGDFKNARRQRNGLEEIKEKGFVKAYTKSFPEEMAIKIGKFESGNSQEGYLEESLLPQVEESTESEQHAVGSRLIMLSASDDLYPPISSGKYSDETRFLQAELQTLGYFSDSLDGLYNRQTEDAYLQYTAQDPQWLKYSILGNHWLQNKIYPVGSLTQNAISMMGAQPDIAVPILNSTNHPMAIGYLQFYKFLKEGPGTSVSSVFKDALEKAARGKDPDSSFYQKTINLGFENLPDILRGIAFLHQMYPSFKVPCWIFEKYPKISDLAFTPAPAGRNFPYNVEDCEGFSDWAEVKTLKAILKDLEIASTDSLSTLSLLYHTGFLTDDSLQVALASWEEQFMQQVSEWRSKNTSNQRTGTVLTVAFYQCLLRIESYFSAKNAGKEDALALARASLRLMVGDTFQPDKP